MSELGRVQSNNNSINEISVRVGVRGRKLKVGAACSQVVGVCFLRRDEVERTWHGLPRIFRKNRMSAASMIS